MKCKLFLVGLVSTIISFCFTSAVLAGTVTSEEEIAISTTGGGIKVKSDNGNTFSFGGRIQYDFDNFDGLYNTDFTDSKAGDDASESEFRRTRFNFQGTAGENWAYKMDILIDEGEAEINEAHIAYKGFGFADILIGRFKVGFSLAEMTSSKWINTIERPVTTEFGFLRGKPPFSLGLRGHTDSLFYQASIVDEDREDDDGKDVYSLAGRFGGHFDVAENSFVHLGASYALRDLDNEGGQTYRTRLGVHTADRITVADGTIFGVDEANQYGLEAAGVFGPFAIQAEYSAIDYDKGDELVAGTGLNANGDPVADVDVEGYYVQASYFLTGEQRSYKPDLGRFDKVKPKGLLGAWQLVAQYEDGEVDPDKTALALAGSPTQKSEYDLLTLGVNWYANQNAKFMLNYLDGDTDKFFSPAGDLLDGSTNPLVDETDGNAISFRAQYVF